MCQRRQRRIDAAMSARRALAPLLLSLCAGCGDGHSLVMLTLQSAAPLSMDRLEVTLDNAGMSAHVEVGDGTRFDIPPDRTFALQIDEGRSGEVAIQVAAMEGGTQVASAAGRVTLDPGHSVPLSLSLQPVVPGSDMGDRRDLAAPDGGPADLAAGTDGPGRDLAGADLRVAPDMTLHCGNKLVDGDETDVDCGGATCARCLFRKACLVDADCQSGGCLARRCGATVLTFAGPTVLASGALPADSPGVATGDLDGDGDNDIACARRTAPSLVTTWLNDGSGNFSIGAPLGATGASAVAVGALDGAAPLDIAFFDEVDASVGVLLGMGDGKRFSAPTLFATLGQGAATLEPGDLDGDGFLDVVVAHAGSSSLLSLRGNGMGGFRMASASMLAGPPSGVALGDLDGDGRLDAVACRAGASGIEILLNDKAGGLLGAVPLMTGGQPVHAAVGDLDRDGKADLIIARTDDALTVATGDGKGGAARTAIWALPARSGPRYVIARDLNLDGKLDVAVALSLTNQVAVLVGHGDGTFAAPVLLAGVSPQSVASADLNGDGSPDLVAGNGGTNTCSVYLNAAR